MCTSASRILLPREKKRDCACVHLQCRLSPGLDMHVLGDTMLLPLHLSQIETKVSSNSLLHVLNYA